MKFNFGLLKLVYKSFLFGFPKIVYNPSNNNIFHSSYTVLPYSTYVNYEINNLEYNYLNNNLFDIEGGLKMDKIKIENNEEKKYYVSINIYNCSSPLFELLGKDSVTRCEINTYVKDKNEEPGTLIMDYTSNMLSMDPVNIFKSPSETIFKMNDNLITCFSKSENIHFNMSYHLSKNDSIFEVHKDLHAYTDNIFYANGIYDKLYYDKTLIHGKTLIPNVSDIYFRLGSIVLTNPSSVFYFEDTLNFAGGMWYNIFNNRKAN